MWIYSALNWGQRHRGTNVISMQKKKDKKNNNQPKKSPPTLYLAVQIKLLSRSDPFIKDNTHKADVYEISKVSQKDKQMDKG